MLFLQTNVRNVTLNEFTLSNKVVILSIDKFNNEEDEADEDNIVISGVGNGNDEFIFDGYWKKSSENKYGDC